MAAVFKKSITTQGKFKNLVVRDGSFVDDETGEIINVAKIIESAMGEVPFDLSVSQKTEDDVTPDSE